MRRSVRLPLEIRPPLKEETAGPKLVTKNKAKQRVILPLSAEIAAIGCGNLNAPIGYTSRHHRCVESATIPSEAFFHRHKTVHTLWRRPECGFSETDRPLHLAVTHSSSRPNRAFCFDTSSRNCMARNCRVLLQTPLLEEFNRAGSNYIPECDDISVRPLQLLPLTMSNFCATRARSRSENPAERMCIYLASTRICANEHLQLAWSVQRAERRETKSDQRPVDPDPINGK